MSDRPLGVVPFGDRALLVHTTDVGAAHDLSARLARDIADHRTPAAVEEVVVGFANVLVVLDPAEDADGVVAGAHWLADASADGSAGADRRSSGPRPLGRTHILPVVFDGADLAVVADTLGQPVDRVVGALVAAELEVAFVGFAPGFPYLTGLPDEFAALPRRATPRTSVPAGSVAVAAGFASIYPRPTPGGWQLVGRTAETLFDPDVPPHSRMAPGDRVRFTPVDGPLPEDPAGTARPLLATDDAVLEILEPGLATTVQDGGRIGCARLGVPAAGAADPLARTLANLLVGNPGDAAALECTASGPTFRVSGDTWLAVVGVAPGAVEVTVDGHDVADGAVVPLSDGQTVRVGRIRAGLRAYVALAGGLDAPVLFGSRSSDTLAGLGPGPLRRGDRLARDRPDRRHDVPGRSHDVPGRGHNVPGRARGRLEWPDGTPGAEPTRGGDRDPTVLRVVPGPHGSPGDGLVSATWTVSGEADRIGVRLDAADGPPLVAASTPDSTPMMTGAVQVPPDGRPIVLLPDHATVGGYPVVACVVTADLPILGQLVPGGRVAFVEVDGPTAAGLRVAASRAADARVSGWYPTVAGS